MCRRLTVGLVFAGLAAGLATGRIALAQLVQPSSTPQLQVNLPPQPPPGADAAEPSATELAEKLENPIGDLYNVPFQNNTNFNVGPHSGTQDILNIQPVIPIHATPDWNIITRTILPLVWSPSFQPGASVPPFGLGPTTFSAFLSPSKTVDGWLWGVGPIVQLPTISNKTLGSNVWGAGPAFVIVRTIHPWVYGALINNVFSFGGTSGPAGTKYSLLTLQPFLNYNLGDGWFISTSPIITSNWLTGGEHWTLPVGANAGRLIKLGGKLPVNLLVGAYYNALRPTGGGTWQLRTQIAIIF
jgi:hypothetical protein